MIITIFNTLKDLRNFSLLLFIFCFAYTLLGLEFFAFKLKFDSDDKFDPINGVSPRTNFDGFYNAINAVF